MGKEKFIEQYLNVFNLNIPRFADLPYGKINVDISNGWKISIQGKEKKDALFLIDKLFDYLDKNDIPFKVAIEKRFNLLKHDDNRSQEQGHKVMTIYCPNNYDFNKLCEDVYQRTINYDGWYDVKCPTSYEHYAGGLYTRSDRDENGRYIRAN